MRKLLLFCLLLASCSEQSAAPSLQPGTYTGQGRDRLCIAGEAGALRAGLIAYGQGDVNCSASGSLQQAGEKWVLLPKGEGDCRIPLNIADGSVTVGHPPAACAYYCGPGATMAGKVYQRSESSSKAVDLAGDQLCK